MTLPPLPSRYERWVGQLSAPAWRERKQAVTALRELVELDVDDLDALERLAERLLDGLVSDDALNGRASCHEVLVAIGKAALPGLLRRIEQPGTGQRLLVDLLGEIGDRSQSARLVRIVTNPQEDTNLRGSAAVALGKLGGSDAAAALASLLHDPIPMLRMHALEALRAGGLPLEPEVARPLLADPYTRKAAAAVLGNTDRIEAARLLVPLLGDDRAGVRAAAAVSLARLDGRLAHPSSLAPLLRDCDADTREKLRALLDHSSVDVQAAAMLLAGLAEDAEILPRLLERMDEPALGEQVLATVAALGQAAAGVALQIARDVPEMQRQHLLRVLGVLPTPVDPRLLEVLTEGLQQAAHDEERAVAAAESLERVGTQSTLPELFRAMSHPGRGGEAAAAAVVAILRRAAVPEALDAVLGVSWPHEGPLAANLCRVFGELGSVRHASHLVTLLGSVDTSVRVAAATALGQLPGEHEGASALAFALADEEPQVRAAACRSLGQLHAPSSVHSLLTATEDRSAIVRATAVQALVAMNDPAALPRLRAIIAEDPVPSVVVQAIAGLGAGDLDQDLTMLMSLCTSEDWEVVKAAARALRSFSEHRATAALLGLLSHPRWDVRWAAAEVLALRDDETALQPLRQALPAERDRVVRKVIRDAIEHLESIR